MFKKLRIQFVAVFMIIMTIFSAVLGGIICYEQKSKMEYDCMVYLLNVINYDNFKSRLPMKMDSYPPFFVISIDNTTDTAEVVLGEFFLESRGVTVDDLIRSLVGQMLETGILEEYKVRFYNGVRSGNEHRVAFMDVSYIDNAIRRTASRTVLFAVPSLVLMFFVAILLSGWFVRPAKTAMDEQRRFISFASHELKTPISIVSANIDLLERSEGQDDPNYAFSCDNIRYECGRMQSLIEAMVWMALPAKAEELAEVDVSEMLREELLRFEVRAFENGLMLESAVDDGIMLLCDRVQLQTVLDILLDNALKYTTPGGMISVTAEMPHRKLRLAVANTGEEIPREERENIFKPFYQIDSIKDGAGIGLSIAREVVTALHGSIRVTYEKGQNCFAVEI